MIVVGFLSINVPATVEFSLFWDISFKYWAEGVHLTGIPVTNLQSQGSDFVSSAQNSENKLSTGLHKCMYFLPGNKDLKKGRLYFRCVDNCCTSCFLILVFAKNNWCFPGSDKDAENNSADLGSPLFVWWQNRVYNELTRVRFLMVYHRTADIAQWAIIRTKSQENPRAES